MSMRKNHLWADSSTCCLICSILPSLSDTNCCTKHSTLLTTDLSKQVVHKIPSKMKQKYRYRERLKPITLTSFNANNHLLSPTRSILIETPSNHSSKSTMTKRKRSYQKPVASSTDETESNDFIPRILLKRVIHVKDDDEEEEESNSDHSRITLNMSQATKQMANEENGQPRIFLKRVRLEE